MIFVFAWRRERELREVADQIQTNHYNHKGSLDERRGGADNELTWRYVEVVDSSH